MRRDFEKHLDVGIVFLLAETEVQELQLEVEDEAAANGDILQVGLVTS